MIQLGTVLNDRFQLEELIGSGGMSLIFKGIDLERHRTVAIKMLREQYADDPVFIARFRREGQAVSVLSHPNIVKIYSVCQDDNIYYLVLELIEGKDLKQILYARVKPFEPREIYPIIAQVCDAVEYAHHKGVIHRDIKPHNIIMSPDGQVKVTDFGIARAASEATVTHAGSIMGSVHYLSPEQAKGELADHRSDIYSLGVLLYEMATGMLPYEGESPISVAVQKIQQDPAPPRVVNPDAAVPEALEQVILRAMNRNPQRRYQTALQLRDDLREACFNNRLLYAGEPEIDAQEDTLDGETLSQALGKQNNSETGGEREGNRSTRVDPGGYENAATSEDDEMAGKSGSRSNGSGEEGRAGGRLLRVALWIGVFCAIAAGGLALGRYISDLLYSPSVDVYVPLLIEMTQSEAARALEEAGLTMVVASSRVARDSIPAGSVAAQEPAATTPVRPRSSVTVTLSSGPATHPAPNLSGETTQSASLMLANLGLALGSVETINDTKTPEGVILGQTPDPGTPLLAGSKVDIVVSLGPEVHWIRVQSFVGMPVTEAQASARNLGFEFGRTEYEMSWTYPKDTIIRQSPAGETEMKEGTPIEIVVSLGPGPG